MVESFHWILPGLLAGSGRPGLIGDLEEDLGWLRGAGIRHIVSLTQEALRTGEAPGYHLHHFPISDMGIPTPRRTEGLCRHILGDIARHEPVLLHCKAGLGRTGTILACCLVSLGASAGAAIERIRSISRFYIQTHVQQRFVHHYAEFLREQAAADLLPETFRTPAPEPADTLSGKG